MFNLDFNSKTAKIQTMRTRTLLIIVMAATIALLFSSCDHKTLDKAYAESARVIEYDGCEYITNGSGNCRVLAHKGNCKYCAARLKNL